MWHVRQNLHSNQSESVQFAFDSPQQMWEEEEEEGRREEEEEEEGAR